MRCTVLLACALLFVSCGRSSKPDDLGEARTRSFRAPADAGLVHLEDPGTLALLGGGALTDGDLWYQSFSSVDHSGINNDGFKPVIDHPAPYTRAWEYYDTEKREAVLAEVKGTGIITRIRFARVDGLASTDHELGHDDYDVKIYLDDPDKPIITATMAQLVSGKAPGLPKPFVAGEADAAGGLFINLALPFRNYCRVSTTGTPHFHAISILRMPAEAEVVPFDLNRNRHDALTALKNSGRQAADTDDLESVAWQGLVAAGAAETCLEIKGGATIRELSIRPENGQWDEAVRAQTWVEVRYDGEPEPRINVPLGLFSGSGLHAGSVTAVTFGRRSDGTAWCRYPMPFEAECRLSLRNRSGRPISFEVTARIARGTKFEGRGYFSARYHRSQDPLIDQDVQALRVRGRGRLVGMVEDLVTQDLMVQEGNARIFADGLRTPVHQSDGHETWWGWAWYRGPLDTPYQLPTQGYTHKSESDGTWRLSFYRTLVTDFIPFEHGLDVCFEHGPVNSTKADYRIVTFFYHQDEPGMTRTDRVDVGDAESERTHNYHTEKEAPATERVAVFESRESADLTDSGRTPRSASSFHISIDPANRGVRLVRLSDPTRPETPQEALVYVDGQFAGTWFQPHYNASRTTFYNNKLQADRHRWLEDVFSIPARLTEKKSTLAIKIVPRGHWTEYAYTVWSLR